MSYRAAPNNASGWYHNFDGQVWLARSRVGGRGGIGGPYADVGVILHREDGRAQPWEGLQGDDSFFAFVPAGGGLAAFYGSGDTGHGPEPTGWRVGLAESESGGIRGPWRRRTGNPVVMNGNRTENPIVEFVPRRGGGAYVAVFDDLSSGGQVDGFTYSWSADGLSWAPVVHVSLPGGCRAPLGLVYEGGGAMSLWYTCGRVGGPTVSPQCVNGSAYDTLYFATLDLAWEAA